MQQSTFRRDSLIGDSDRRGLTSRRMKITLAVFGVNTMPKGEQRGNREAKKPKKDKAKNIVAAPSTQGTVGAAVDSAAGSKQK